ncbi:MAG: flagellar M-ring protein FliF [bacterium]|nr:flagellar M-ring protein FliF [bacterium]
MDGIKQFIDTIRERIGALTFNQKVLLGAVGVASVISVAVFSMWLGHEENSVLFTNLSPEDASTALAELAKQDVTAELANGGTTILVPENEVHRLRVDLAARGIPSSGVVGFEIFDGKQYGLTEFLQNVNFKRATEGELTKTIEGLQGIQSARVHLVLPKPSIFARLAAEATASVVVSLGRGSQLGEGRIAGIQSLVAAAVENLATDKVTVLDQHGKVLSAAQRSDDVGRSANQLELRKEVETHLSSKAASMLDRVLGPGKSIVQVDAILNFEKIDREREIYDPAATVVRSEARTDSSDPESGGTTEQSETNYEINRTVERIVGETGGVRTLSVAVFVDGHYTPSEEDGGPVYAPLSDEELGQLRRIVQTAVGLNQVRGDQIEVVNMQFQQPVGGFGQAGGGATPGWIDIVGQYGGRVVLLVLLGVMVLVLRRNIGRLVADAFGPGNAATGGSRSAARAGGAAADDDDMQGFDGIPELNNQMVQDIQEYATENPDRVAEVIQSWIQGVDAGERTREAVGE